MTESEIADVATRWMQLQALPQDSSEAKQLMRAAIQVNMMTIQQPEECWKVVMKIFGETTDEWILTNLGAGPIESLLSRHPDMMLPMVEREAKTNKRFKDVLNNVWQNQMSDEVWQRLQAVRSE